jgi:isopenicillin N synthase-like dioxygenase
MELIPLVDFSALSLQLSDDNVNEVAAQQTAEQLTNSLETIGFAYLSNTEFPKDLVGSPVHFVAVTSLQTERSS